MSTNTVIAIVVAVVVVLLLILGLSFMARSARDKKRLAESDRIRDEAREESARVEKREAIAAETEAKARAAAAEAEAKAAEAARLSDRAASHRDEAASSREELDSKFQHADSLDPRRKDDADAAYALAEKERAKHEDVRHDGLTADRDNLQPTERTERDPQHRVVN